MAAFGVGEGLLSLMSADAEDASAWQVLAAALPALLVFILPGVIAVTQGRTAVRLGRRDGRVPALIGAAVGLGFVALNLASYRLGLLAG